MGRVGRPPLDGGDGLAEVGPQRALARRGLVLDRPSQLVQHRSGRQADRPERRHVGRVVDPRDMLDQRAEGGIDVLGQLAQQQQRVDFAPHPEGLRILDGCPGERDRFP